jgi:hypothetical protein
MHLPFSIDLMFYAGRCDLYAPATPPYLCGLQARMVSQAFICLNNWFEWIRGGGHGFITHAIGSSLSVRTESINQIIKVGIYFYLNKNFN